MQAPLVQPPAARPAAPWVGGVLLVAIGLILLAGQLIPDAGRFFVLALGLIFLTAFVATRQYGFLVPGGILTGLGVGVILVSYVPAGLASGAVIVGSLALGFAFIWLVAELVRVPERHPWPLIPAVILGAVAGALATGEAEAARWVGVAVGVAFVFLGAAILWTRGRRAR